MNYLLELKINRFAKGLRYTIGRLSYTGYNEEMNTIENDPLFCNTLEDVVRVLRSKEDKIEGETAIPAGKYQVVMSFSNRFQRILPLLLKVPYFTGVRIHRGNFDKDTDGCILVGINNKKGMVTNSAYYEIKLCNLISKYQKCWLEIR